MNSEEIRPGLLLRFASRKALPLSCGSSLVAPVEGPEESLSGCGLRSLPGVPNRNVNLSMPHLAHLIIPFSGEIRARAA
jgi:hypothetical protein